MPETPKPDKWFIKRWCMVTLRNRKLSLNLGKQHKHVYHGLLPIQLYHLHMTEFGQQIYHAYKHPEDGTKADGSPGKN